MNYHNRYARLTRPISFCLAGGGAFGQSLLAQARYIPRMNPLAAVDISADAAGRAFLAAGYARTEISLCNTASEANAAFASGKRVASGCLDVVMELPFDLLVEATGHPEAAAQHAVMAIEGKRHVLLVTKETDSVAGPQLAKMARTNGVGLTPVDGDQPSLLIDLVTWGETLGFDIICAGKSSEYDFVFDHAAGRVVSNGTSADIPDLKHWWSPAGRSLRETAASRAALLRQHFPLRAVPDLCEMTLVANACGLDADHPAFHAPVARIPEVADLLSGNATDGLLGGARRLDVFHHLRAPDEASFAGGVFIVVRCQDRPSWQVLAGKGHAVSADGDTAMLYLPRHLLGVEAATSIFDLVGLGMSAYPDHYAQRVDLAAVATRDLPAGTLLEAKGHHHTIDGVTAEMHAASPIDANQIMPYYLAANCVLANAVKSGMPIKLSDLAMPDNSVLLRLRREQDSAFGSH